jgi:hypothetical protein
MSRGSPVVVVRVPRALLAAINEAVGSANYHRPWNFYDRAKWLRRCVEEKLAKLARGRRPRRRPTRAERG